MARSSLIPSFWLELVRLDYDAAMKLAVLSDIHGNLPALEAVVADAEGRGCTAFVNLCDILSGPLWPCETADSLMPRGWSTISGNHERQLLTLSPERMNLSDRH